MRRGFTLIETMVVLLVLALAAGIAGPAIGRGVDSIRLRAEVAGVASFLRGARERAIARHRAVEVSVEEDGQGLVLTSGEPEERSSRRLPAFVHVSTEPPRARPVAFYAYGLSTGGAFRIEGEGAIAYVIRIDALTGRVSTRRSGS